MRGGGRAMRTLALLAGGSYRERTSLQPGCSTLFRAQRKPVMNREKKKLPCVLARARM